MSLTKQIVLRKKSIRIRNVLKYFMMFFLGLSSIFFVTKAFNIVPITPNAIIYIKSIFLTASGTHTSATGIVLEGSGGHGWFKGSVTIADLPDAALVGTNGSGTLKNATSGEVYNLISGYVFSGTSTDRYLTGMNFDNENNILSLYVSGANTVTGIVDINSLWTIGIGQDFIYNTNFSERNVSIGMDNTPKATLQVSGNIIAGNYSNVIHEGNGSAIIGGSGNSITGNISIIGGGFNNDIQGGGGNMIVGSYGSTISMGINNGSIVGGSSNSISGSFGRVSFMGGSIFGSYNSHLLSSAEAPSRGSIIVGGLQNNIVNSMGASIGGGRGNIVSGANYSRVGGVSASALHDNSFVWNTIDEYDFFTTQKRSFIINAPYNGREIYTGGVGINTNTPRADLHVAGYTLLSGNVEIKGYMETLGNVTTTKTRVHSGIVIDNQEIDIDENEDCSLYGGGTITYDSGSFFGCILSGGYNIRKKLHD